MTMNSLDALSAVILLSCVILCSAKGLIISIFNLVSLYLTYLLTNRFYPVLSEHLSATPLFGGIEKLILERLSSAADIRVGSTVTDAVNAIPAPDFFKDIVAANLRDAQITPPDASGMLEYVSSFAAKLAIDGISIAVVFTGLLILMSLAAEALRLIVKLPVLRSFNRLGGAVMGLLAGSILVWLVLSVLSGIFASSPDFPVADLLNESVLAKYFSSGLK